jgi:hypothetical protein
MSTTNNTKPVSTTPIPPTPSGGTKAPNFDPPPSGGGGGSGNKRSGQ